MNVAYLFTQDQEAAQDFAQEAFLRILEAMAKGCYARTAEFSTSLYRIVRNLCLNHFTRHKEIPFEHPLPEWAEESDLNKRIDRMNAQKYLSALSPQHRNVFILYYLQCKSYADIAAHPGISEKSEETFCTGGDKKSGGIGKNNFEEQEGGCVFKEGRIMSL